MVICKLISINTKKIEFLKTSMILLLYKSIAFTVKNAINLL